MDLNWFNAMYKNGWLKRENGMWEYRELIDGKSLTISRKSAGTWRKLGLVPTPQGAINV